MAGQMTKTAVDWKTVYNSGFETQYRYDGELGALCRGNRTRFRLWSPVADSVSLLLYPDAEAGEPEAVHPMERSAEGVFSYDAEENLHGHYYEYLLVIDGKEVRTGDPYAYSCSANGVRSMAVDHSQLSPEGWDLDKAPAKQNEDIIYELHVKEFSWDTEAGFSAKNRGKYLAFTEDRTSLFQNGADLTGIAYLKHLGVTHVQLMPVYDFGSVDEAGDPAQFNWGYDPVNYFVPEGSYASDAQDGRCRVLELKQMVQALHRAGIRVVMDVVFNHTYSFENALQRTMPWYFYRQRPDGSPSNGSACGNDVASERVMCAKLITDCVLYWAKEYHMDGFRFDLMGLLDVDLMNGIRRQLDKVYGVGEKLVYGEPWAAAETFPCKPCILAKEQGLSRLAPGIGYFSDAIRDGIKGSALYPKEPGYVNGAQQVEEELASIWLDAGRDPSRIISYVSCHDNQTLWDKLTETTEIEPLRRQEARLAAALYFCMPGRILLLSGEEYLRTKFGYSNTYNAPIELNRLDWKASVREQEMVAYYRGLIALRKLLPGLYRKERMENGGDAKMRVDLAENGILAFWMKNAGMERVGGKRKKCWKELFLVFNRKQCTVDIPLPEGEWVPLADGANSFLWKKNPPSVAGSTQVAEVSMLALGRV